DDRLTIVFSSDYFDTYLELFDEDGNLIAADDDGGKDHNSMLWNIVLPETGEYSIAARSFNNTAQGAYSLNVESSTIELSGTLIYGGSDTGDLDQGEWLVWSFEAIAGDIVSIALDSDDFDAFLELRGNNGLILAEDDDGGETGSNSLISEYLITETGTYLIVVRAYSDTETGEFSLSLNEE
ncbi:MAG: PPC domain-containing protein, partial [Chloroflexota bacterium]